MTRVQLGAMGEALAVDHLTRMGLRILGPSLLCRPEDGVAAFLAARSTARST
jgi:hypothetical protein